MKTSSTIRSVAACLVLFSGAIAGYAAGYTLPAAVALPGQWPDGTEVDLRFFGAHLALGFRK